ncbi:MAG: WecB/TagA/CpsF family glycosyltransferase [Ignavibacteria bacterium]|nr:WecB/TagA/CpsF family glycosyltransferase [Ignavibacteria bacterium]
MSVKTEHLLDTPVHAVTYHEVLSAVTGWIADHDRKAATIVHTNALTLVTAQEDRSYREVVRGADLSLPDGMPIVWLLRRRGFRMQSRIYGPDLLVALAEQAAAKGWRCFLYGGAPGVPEAVERTLEDRFPGILIVGTCSPPFRPLTADEDDEISAMIRAARPDILWVSLGGAKQDRWIAEHRTRLGPCVMHGVGAAFDFLAGKVPQAPRWMMNAGLEWLFRLLVEPRRLWKRYTVKNFKFCYYVMTREILRRAKTRENI